MMAMAAKGKRDQRPAKSISTPQISAMMAKRDARVSVTIEEPSLVILVRVSNNAECPASLTAAWVTVGWW